MIEIINESDFDRLFEIEQAAHLVPWSKGTLLNNQGDKYLNLKLTEQDQIVAFAICQTVLDEATLFNIAVDPSFQAKGYGKRLLSALIERLREQGISTLWLEVRESNLTAQNYMTHSVLMKSLFVKLLSDTEWRKRKCRCDGTVFIND
ncbi:ribosomal-protein-alanine N-acetyltransferase [Actinobacillus equuli]|nr:ribosomal-protein-alanine N-acetyltransferase [Actinobacillus equuli]